MLFTNEKMRNIMHNKYILITIMSIMFVSVLSIYFIVSNENIYKKTIAKITSISEEADQVIDMNGKAEPVKKQKINAIIMNGIHKGEKIQLNNTSSFSQVNDNYYKVNDEVFVSIQEAANKQIANVSILDFKRDKYILYISLIFILFILIIGGFKGFRSLISVLINILIFLASVEMFIYGANLAVVSIIACILFIILSITIVSGKNKKTISAIIATMASTLISMLVAVLVIQVNHWNGIHFEEMEFLTHPPEIIFLMEILIGTLGAIMDIAISISSSINEIYDKNPHIERKIIISSSKEIGKDIMGTMANTIVLAYISGSIPIILLLLRNGYSISSIVNINLSLEIIRALTGSIGIVLSVPISIYTSMTVFKNYKIGEV